MKSVYYVYEYVDPRNDGSICLKNTQSLKFPLSNRTACAEKLI